MKGVGYRVHGEVHTSTEIAWVGSLDLAGLMSRRVRMSLVRKSAGFSAPSNCIASRLVWESAFSPFKTSTSSKRAFTSFKTGEK